MKGWASRYRAILIGASLLGALLVPAPAHATAPPRAWLGAVDGGVFTMGSAPFRGSKGGTSLPSPVIAIAARPSGNGYWLASLAGDERTLRVLAYPLIGPAGVLAGLLPVRYIPFPLSNATAISLSKWSLV